MAQTFGPHALTVILTGMGQDGLRGCEAVREAGGQVLAQDEATSVVWGMPGYVARAGLADRVLPLSLNSLAMLCREHFPELKEWKLSLLASDLSREMLARAREGRFNQLEVNRGLPATLLVKYFEQHGSDWHLKPAIRAGRHRRANAPRVPRHRPLGPPAGTRPPATAPGPEFPAGHGDEVVGEHTQRRPAPLRRSD